MLPRFNFSWLSVALLALTAAANDWPCWRGPDRNGISRETNWLSDWPSDGPRQVWKAAVGIGFASVSVSQNRLFTTGNDDNKDTVVCLDAETGKLIWKQSYDSDLGEKFFEGGPTATPTVDGDKVYTLSRWGDVFCFDAASGKVVWSTNVTAINSVRVPGWGFGGSPLVQSNLVILNVGDAGMALNKLTGDFAWTSANKDAGYSTPLPFRVADESLVLLGSAKSYVAVDAATGAERWRFPWLTQYGVNAADPIVSGSFVLISSGYGKGAALLDISSKPPTAVWQSRDFRNQFSSSVLLDGFIYGIDGDTTVKAALKCVEFRSGAIKWTREGIGSGALMAADGKLIILSDHGELMIAEASPDRFKPLANSQVMGGKCWIAPVLANGRTYCRNAAGSLVCLDVRAKR
jgi:outer membrane protein assembly factor BamB